MTRALIFTISLCIEIACQSAAAQSPNTDPPVVLFDSGNTKPLFELFASEAPPLREPPPALATPQLNGAFPVETPSMGLGRFATAPWPDHSRWRGAPLFLFGSDRHSLAWLQANRDKLKSLGATGILIEAPSDHALLRAREIAPDIPIMAASGEEIANHTGLRLYPVIVTRDGIDQ